MGHPEVVGGAEAAAIGAASAEAEASAAGGAAAAGDAAAAAWASSKRGEVEEEGDLGVAVVEVRFFYLYMSEDCIPTICEVDSVNLAVKLKFNLFVQWVS